MIPTWKQKLLCTGCAAVLAAGLVPMAAWGGATEGSEPENATKFAAETPTNDAGVSDDDAQNAGKTETEGGTQTSDTNTPTDGVQPRAATRTRTATPAKTATKTTPPTPTMKAPSRAAPATPEKRATAPAPATRLTALERTVQTLTASPATIPTTPGRRSLTLK